jgi:hypothetical protein
MGYVSITNFVVKYECKSRLMCFPTKGSKNLQQQGSSATIRHRNLVFHIFQASPMKSMTLWHFLLLRIGEKRCEFFRVVTGYRRSVRGRNDDTGSQLKLQRQMKSWKNRKELGLKSTMSGGEGERNYSTHSLTHGAEPFLRSCQFCIVGGGVQTGSTRHVGHLLAYCTCPGWLWGWRIWRNEWQGKPKYSE